MTIRLRTLWLMLALLNRTSAADGDIEIKPLAPDVWLHTSWQTVGPWGLVPSNGLIVRESDQVVVIDTAWGAAPSRALLAWIDRELQLPVARLIVTHFHDDRLSGWEVFAERGTRIVLSEQTVALAEVTSHPAFDVYRLSAGEKTSAGTLEILFPGPAHAPDNVVVWVPSSRTLVGGCAVRAAASGGLGNLSHASVVDWAASIARVQAAYPDARIVVPGHGDAGGTWGGKNSAVTGSIQTRVMKRRSHPPQLLIPATQIHARFGLSAPNEAGFSLAPSRSGRFGSCCCRTGSPLACAGARAGG